MSRKLLQHEKDVLLDGLAEGIDLGTIAKSLGISRRTLTYMITEDPETEKLVAQSRAIYADSLIDDLLNIANGCNTMADVQRAKLDSENRRWIASKFSPKLYADNIQVSVQHHLDLSSVLLAAESRIIPLVSNQSQKVIEVMPSTEVDESLATDDSIDALL